MEEELIRLSAINAPAMKTQVRDEDGAMEREVVDQMLQIVDCQADVALSSTVPTVTEQDIRKIYRDVGGDPSRVYDEVMTLLTVRALRLEEENVCASQDRAKDAKLQWHELCVGLGLSECHDFVRILEAMPEEERDAALSEHGGFFQQLLLGAEKDNSDQRSDSTFSSDEFAWDEEEGEQDFEEDEQDEEEHPLEQLQRMFPDYKLNVIEDVFDAHNFDVEATASALFNIEAVSQVKSFASVIKAKGPTTLWSRGGHQSHSHNHSHSHTTPVVESLGHFPVLPAHSKQKHRKHRGGKAAGGAKKVEYKTLDEFVARGRGTTVPRHVPKSPRRSKSPRRRLSKHVHNAWDAQASPRHGKNGGAMESKLTTDLKLQRLYRLLPSVDREVIRTSFFLNDASSTATEAALREIFHLPVPEPLQVAGPPGDDDDTTTQVVATANAHLEADPTYAECRARVDNCWGQLSDRYIAALQSFNRNHHVIVGDRVRDIATGRAALRQAQHDAAHAFVKGHFSHIRRQQAIDLHGLTVLEANRVTREVIDLCRSERIRRCILICGVGNHSINQKARLLTSIQLSLEHRRIAFRKESGTLFIYPLRSTG